MNANHRHGSVANAPFGLAQAASATEPTESTMLQIADVATDFEEARTDLFEIVRGTTPCSSTVFYGLLAWANLRAHKPSKAEITIGQQGIGPHS